MLKRIKNIDSFGRNIILVFLGTTLLNIFNLVYQLLIAHRLPGTDFAGFNSLLAVFMLFSAPLMTLQTAVSRYTAEFKARNRPGQVAALLLRLAKTIFPLALITFVIFYFSSPFLIDKLKIYSVHSGWILSALLALSWFTPVLLGALQGLELFKWLVFISIIGGALKIIFALAFVNMGFNIAGALAALLFSGLIAAIISFLPLKDYFLIERTQIGIGLRDFLSYLAPVAVSLFCFMTLISFDMVLVKYLFNAFDAGFYSLGQMVGKIFLFLPGAISIVMFPKTAGLNARNMDTYSTLKRSLSYALILCVSANLFYNLFPDFTLKVLTGKSPVESIALGRLFGISMSFFAFLTILINYFLSIKDMRFIKYLIISAVLQPLAIVIFHASLLQVQFILCVNSILIFIILRSLAYKIHE